MNLSEEWQTYSKNKAEEILREFSEYQRLKAPIPIDEIIESYVGDVQFITHEDYDFPPGVSAFAQKDIQLGWIVVVNGLECIERQRFSSAHELGHIVLIPNHVGKVFCSEDKESWHEKLCDRFAGHILMPEWLIERFYHLHPSHYVEDIAKYFKVSRPVAEIQLRILGLPFKRKFRY